MEAPNTKKQKPKRERIPQSDVFAWLAEYHPSLAAVAEAERAWVWIACGVTPLSAEVEKAILEYGFIRSKKGHLLPSGRLGIYGHSCEKPIPFKRKPRHAGAQHQQQTESAQEEVEESDVESEALAFLAGV